MPVRLLYDSQNLMYVVQCKTGSWANVAGGQSLPGSRPASAKRPASGPLTAPPAKKQATKQEEKQDDMDVLEVSIACPGCSTEYADARQLSHAAMQLQTANQHIVLMACPWTVVHDMCSLGCT